MPKAASPLTGAERQRAYRARRGEGEAAEEDISLPELNARMRRMAAQAFDEVGGVEYLKRVAGKNANTFLRFVGQFVTREDSFNPGAFNIFVQKISIEGAAPVAGVISSPVAAHIDAARQLPGPLATEVIEEERNG